MKKSSLIFLIFFILLTAAPVPVFYAFREQIGYKNTENKAQSEFPGIHGRDYSTWPRRFEEWLLDTLPFKTQFIELYRGAQLRAGLDYSQSDVLRGKDEVLFYRQTIENYKGLTRFTEEELQTIENNLNAFIERLDAMGTKCMLYIAPDKEQVCSLYMPDNIRRITSESRADQLVSWLRPRIAVPILYPKAELTELSREYPVYFSTDTHWNELGGWIAAEQIREAFTGESSPADLPAFSREEQNGKDLAGMLGLSDRIPEKNAVKIDYADGVTPQKVQTINYGRFQRFVSDAPARGKLMLLGDSFSEYCLRSAIHDTNEVLFVTYGQLSLIDLEAEHPDYLVIMLVERNLPFLLNGFY